MLLLLLLTGAGGVYFLMEKSAEDLTPVTEEEMIILPIVEIESEKDTDTH